MSADRKAAMAQAKAIRALPAMEHQVLAAAYLEVEAELEQEHASKMQWVDAATAKADELEQERKAWEEAQQRSEAAIASWDEERQMAEREGRRVVQAEADARELWAALKQHADGYWISKIVEKHREKYGSK